MMKSKYLGITIVIVLTFITSVGFVHADDFNQTMIQPIESTFPHECELLFNGQGTIYDQDGNDITTSFVERYQLLFQAQDFDTILSCCFEENVDLIETGQIIVERDSAKTDGLRTILYPTYELYRRHIITQTGNPYHGKRWTFCVCATGSYTYQDSYGGYIVYFPNPTYGFSFEDIGEAFSGSVTSINVTTPVVSGNTATFSITTSHELTCPIPLIDPLTSTLGPFTRTSNFSITGIL